VGRTIRNLTRESKKRGFEWKSEKARKRSAEAGARNLALYRASVTKSARQTHGVVSYLQGRNPPAEIASKLDSFESGLLSDLGHEPTTAQRALIESTRVSLGVVLLASSYLSQGSVSQLKRNRWLLQALGTFLNTTRLNLLALGLERRAKEVLTLDDVVRDISARRATDAKSAAASPEATQVENAAERMETRG
jgi:hypothetical protein